MAFNETKGPGSVEKSRQRRQKLIRMTTSGLASPSWKMAAASILFDICGPSGVPINWNFT